MGNGLIAMHDDTPIQSDGGKRKPISYGLNLVIVRPETQETVRIEVRGMGGGSIIEKAVEFRVLVRHNGAWKLFEVPTP